MDGPSRAEQSVLLHDQNCRSTMREDLASTVHDGKRVEFVVVNPSHVNGPFILPDDAGVSTEYTAVCSPVYQRSTFRPSSLVLGDLVSQFRLEPLAFGVCELLPASWLIDLNRRYHRRMSCGPI